MIVIVTKSAVTIISAVIVLAESVRPSPRNNTGYYMIASHPYQAGFGLSQQVGWWW